MNQEELNRLYAIKVREELVEIQASKHKDIMEFVDLIQVAFSFAKQNGFTHEQLVTHFLIDVWKGRMNGWFPALQSPANKWHWIVFGFDQLLHALVIIGMSLCAVS